MVIKQFELSFNEIEYLRKKGKDVKVQTAKGFTSIGKVYNKYSLGKEIIFNDNSKIICAETHKILSNNDWINSMDLNIGDFATDKFGKKSKKIIKIKDLPEQKWIDFEVLDEFESYLQNEILHHNSGKSLIIYIFMRWALKENKPTILVVPSIGLVTQMAQDFDDYGWSDTKKYLKQIGGEFKGKKDLSEKPLVLSTWQSLANFRNKKKLIYKDIEYNLGEEFDKIYTVNKKQKVKGKFKKITYEDGSTEIIKL